MTRKESLLSIARDFRSSLAGPESESSLSTAPNVRMGEAVGRGRDDDDVVGRGRRMRGGGGVLPKCS